MASCLAVDFRLQVRLTMTEKCCIMLLVQGMVVEAWTSMVNLYLSYNSSNQAMASCTAYFDFANTF
jgi:hypothetical protein